jgi:hypothetical protein
MEVTMSKVKTPSQIRRTLSDNQKMIHQYELQLSGYEGRTCANRDRTSRNIADLKIANRELRDELDEAIAAERKFMKKR